jgi:prepilin-type processing-associated H-X9-DG protein
LFCRHDRLAGECEGDGSQFASLALQSTPLLFDRSDPTEQGYRGDGVTATRLFLQGSHATAWGDYAIRVWASGTFGRPGAVHRGGANVLFCDGHIAWYSQSELFNIDPGTPQGQRPRFTSEWLRLGLEESLFHFSSYPRPKWLAVKHTKGRAMLIANTPRCGIIQIKF